MDIAIADLVIYAVSALLGLAIGWSIRNQIAGGKEASLKRDVLDAKAAVPILETSIRKGDQQISTLEGHVSTLKTREQELNALVEQERTASAKHERELRNANSELKVLRSGGDGDGELFLDDHAAPAPDDSDLMERATRAEERYESLKRGLITRDDRITELEAELEGGSAEPTSSEQLDALESARSELQKELEGRDQTIDELNKRLADEAERREVLESLAKGRGEAKLEQREKLAGLEEELPELRKTLAERDEMINQRVATIASLRDQIDRLETDKDGAEANVVKLTGALVERDSAIAQHDAVMETMNRTLEGHKGQIETLNERIAHTDGTLQAAEQRIAEQDADIAARDARGGEVEGAIDSLKGSLNDRDSTIAGLQNELSQLSEQLDASQVELAQSSAARGLDVARLESETRQAEQRTTELRQTNEGLEARVSTLESAATADRQLGEEMDRSVTDRDLKIGALEGKLLDAQGQIDSVAKERADAQAALQAALEEHEAAQNAEPPPESDAQDGLKAAEQRIKTLEHTLKDRDFRIDSLLQDTAALEAKLEVYRVSDRAEYSETEEVASQ